MGQWSPKADVIICSVVEAQALLKLIKRKKLWRPKKCEPISTLSDSQRVGGCSKQLTILVACPNVGCDYLILLTLRQLIQVGPFNPDRCSGYANIPLLLLCNYGVTWGVSAFRISGLGQLHCLKQQNTNDLISQSVKVINCLSCSLYYVNKVFVTFSSPICIWV